MNSKIIQTVPSKGVFWQEEVREVKFEGDCMHSVELYPDLLEQTIQGFGGAFTEASAHTWSSLPENEKNAVTEGYFGQEGLRYNLGRIPVHSCDFALGNYTYVQEGDESLETFSISHDEAEILPMIAKALETAKKRNAEMEFLASPWSPPAYMKTNGERKHGGRRKAECAGV